MERWHFGVFTNLETPKTHHVGVFMEVSGVGLVG